MNLGSGLTLFAQIESTLQLSDILVVPCIIWAFGLAVWFFAALGRRQGKVQRWKWFLAYGVVIFAAYAGWSGLGSDPANHQGFGPYIFDAFTRAQYGFKRLIYAVYGVFLGPVISLGLMWFFDMRESKHMKELTS